jgi:hypothetical protein
MIARESKILFMFSSYFRSPKLDQKMGLHSSGSDSSSSDRSATGNNDIYKRHLRKTNSWHPSQQLQVIQTRIY